MRDVKKVRGNLLKGKLQKQIRKIADRRVRQAAQICLKGEWTIYVRPYRPIHAIQGSRLVLLRFEQRKSVYE